MTNCAPEKKKVVIVGGGTAGCIVASQLLRKRDAATALDVTVVDPAEHHFYQPGWTLVGAGIKPFAWSRRGMDECIPPGAKWVKDAASKLSPDTKTVQLAGGSSLTYDYLVVAAGLEMNWNFAAGVAENVFKPNSPLVSNYLGGEGTAAAIARFPEGGTAIFHAPLGVIKCGGAPHKAAFLSWDYWRSRGRDMAKLNIEFIHGNKALFHVAHYVPSIKKLFHDRSIATATDMHLKSIEIPPPAGTPAPSNGAPAFEGLATLHDKDGAVVKKPFHMFHVVPPMRAPAVVRDSPLANPAGFVDVNKKTLQSPRYEDVWAIGDCSALPTSKTAAAIMAQAPVLVHNMLQHMDGRTPHGEYNGYTSCPLVVGKNPPSLLLMEFDYDLNPAETFPWDQRVAGGIRGRLHYFMKETVFPAAYWKLALRGRWFGSNTVFEPSF